MVIGDEHLDAARTRRGDTGVARDAVVDGDDQRRRALGGEPDDLGCESVTKLEAVRHQEIHRRKSPASQAPDDQGRAGGAIRIEVADDENAPLAVFENQLDRRVDAFERAHRNEAIERQRQLAAVAHAARRIGTTQHRMQTGIDEIVADRATRDDQVHSSGVHCGIMPRHHDGVVSRLSQ